MKLVDDIEVTPLAPHSLLRTMIDAQAEHYRLGRLAGNAEGLRAFQESERRYAELRAVVRAIETTVNVALNAETPSFPEVLRTIRRLLDKVQS